MAAEPQPVRDLVEGIRQLRREFGPSVCDLILAELFDKGTVSRCLAKLGLPDPGYGNERVDMIINYLRRQGATELMVALTEPRIDPARKDGTDQTRQVDPVLLECLIQDERGSGIHSTTGHPVDATIVEPERKWDPYLKHLFEHD